MTSQSSVVPSTHPALGPNARLIDESLFAPSAEIALQGARCPDCATVTFPVQRGCPRCGTQRMDTVPLPRRGVLWSFTIQSFQPKPPYRNSGEFEPYGVGYVDLGEVVVESRLVENRPEDLAIGAPMVLTLVPVFTDPDRTTVFTFAFHTEGRR